MKYLIASANGYGNTGDDLIAHSISDMLKNVDANAQVRLTRPPIDEPLVQWADAVIVGGGGLLYDYDKTRTNVANYMAYLAAAKKHDVPVYVIGIAEQGIFTAGAKATYRRALDTAQVITVRSQRDQEVLQKDVGTRAPVLALQDVVFALAGVEEPKRRRLQKIRKPRLAFSLACLSGQGLDMRALGSRTAQNLARYDAYIDGPEVAAIFKDFKVTLVCQSRDDLPYYEKLQQQYKVPLIYPQDLEKAPELIEAYKACDVVLTGRFHGLVVAAMLGKPTISVGIKNQKLHKLVQEQLASLQPTFFTIEDFIAKDVLNLVKRLYKAKKIARPDSDEVLACRRLAEVNEVVLEAALLNDFGTAVLQPPKTKPRRRAKKQPAAD